MLFKIYFKAKKVEMKTLDGIITTCGPDGEKKSITKRCADLDKEVCFVF